MRLSNIPSKLLFPALLLALHVPAASAAPGQVRVTWDRAPSSEAVVGFSDNGQLDPHLRYGTSPDAAGWQRAEVVASRSFKSSLKSHFVRLSGLPADSAVYFQACDASGCGGRHWFQTAPTGDVPMTFVAGGDSRTNRSIRQQGNRLAAKVRPRFVMFGGDYTDDNTASQMREWLDDWTLSFASDSIGGVDYKYVAPLLPTIGNHENNEQTTTCLVFGMDPDADGDCSLADTYAAIDIGGLRAYTLNSQLRLSGYESAWTAQRNWLAGDLAQAGERGWRIGQYHVPMFPRTSSKPSSNPSIFDAWAQLFYDHGMNLIEESDSHLVKYTFPVRPLGSSYQETAAGTVYVGEGAWGAPARTADRSNDWVLGQDSFAHLKIIQVDGASLDIRTARFSGEADTAALGRDQRSADPLALPAGLSLWADTAIGPVYSLRQDAEGRSQLADGQIDQSLTVAAARDVQVDSGGGRVNGTSLNADGSDGGKELRVLIGWSLASVPADLDITGAAVRLDVSNLSTGSYDLYQVTASWTEANASWSTADSLGTRIGSVNPGATGTQSIQLNAAGVQLVRDWLAGSVANHGVALRSAGTSDGVDFSSREGNVAPKLVISHSGTSGGGGSPRTYSNGSDYPIDDNATVESPIEVSGRSGNAPADATVAVDIRHTYKGDLKVDLVAPDGSSYNLHNRGGGSANDVIGSYPLDLSDEPLNGTWKLRVNDNANQDTGHIDSWSITF